MTRFAWFFQLSWFAVVAYVLAKEEESCAEHDRASQGISAIQTRHASTWKATQGGGELFSANSNVSMNVSGKSSSWVACTVVAEGEVRNGANLKMCLDVDGDSGRGVIWSHDCDSKDDQYWQACSDGSFRNVKSHACLHAGVSAHNHDRAHAGECHAFPGVPNWQKWERYNSRVRYEHGVRQEQFMLRNEKSKKCLDPWGYSGTNVGVGMYECELDKDDQYFYFRNKGKVLGSGPLRNVESKECVAIYLGHEGVDNLHMHECDGGDLQAWTLYEIGDLVSKHDRRCADVAGDSGLGNAMMWLCEGKADSQWRQFSKKGHSFSLVNGMSKCLDVDGNDGHGNIGTWMCTGEKDQYWEFLPSDFKPPEGRWKIVHGGHQGGGIDYSFKSSATFTSGRTQTAETTFSAEIENSLVFANVRASATLSETMSRSFTSQSSHEETIMVKCETNADGSKFIGGSLWQFVIESNSKTFGHVIWRTAYTACNPSLKKPACAPMYKETSSGCTPL